MKRLICILLVTLLILSGCGNAHTGAGNGTETEGTQQVPTDSTTNPTGQSGTTDTTTENTETPDTTEQTTTEPSTGSDGDEATTPTTPTTTPTAPTNPTVPTEPTVPTTPPATTEKCAHTSTTVINKKTAGCTSNGYTGDTVCSACNTVINKGSNISPKGHTNTKVQNVTSATCLNAGYSGDTYCSDCRTIIARGSSVPATGHTKTEIRNKKDATTSTEGYTGDTVCIACGTTVSKGSTIPKLTTNQVTYTLPNGTTYTVDEDVNITDYTMKLNTKSASHTYYDAERAILSYINKVRGENGLSALRWNEDAYYFVKIRAQETSVNRGHTRPNGKNWETVYKDNGVYLLGWYGEVCCSAVNCNDAFVKEANDIASFFVETWMDSSGHRAILLNSRATSVSISVYLASDGTCYAVANLFYY